ncbi:clan AA aspartic protease [Chryseobacterium capnotolerans]|nr:clan AA aspartic protease [Chryseobacterium capnotolerans]
MSFKDTMKLHMNEQNTIFVKAVLNKVDTLLLNFDTGTSDLVLTQETLKNKIKSSLKSGTNILQIGNKEYQGFNIYPAQLTGHGTDGRFGWDLFDGMIVELNHDKGLMVVHSQLPSDVKSQYSKLPIKYFNNVFLVQVGITQDKVENKDWYLFDTGYQRTAMLDGPLLNEQGFPTDKMRVIKKVIMKGAQGNEIPVMTSNLQSLSLGKSKLNDIPVQLLSQSRLVTGSRMNILGNEVLKRFNLFLDFQKNIVYMKPNKLVNVTYIESK